MSQNHSEYVSGRTPEKSLIAIIRFSTDRAEIDDNGLRVLSTLFGNFRIILEDYRVQFTCLGLADRRGSFRHNVDLGMRRAVEVKNRIDRVFGFLPNYTGIAAYSLGESLANQLAKKAADLALDREVKIYSTWSRVPLPVIPTPPAVYQTILRTTARSFSKSTFENSARPDFSSDPKSGINAGIALVRGEVATFENEWGSEDKSSRRNAKMDASYRVNKVVQTLYYSFDVGASVFEQKWKADISYEWGVPKDYVRVEVKKNIAGEERYDASYVSRSKADSSALITPPDP
jgi:hypothetical protein